MGVRLGTAVADKAVHGTTPVAVYAGESLELAKEGHPHVSLAVQPAYAAHQTVIASATWTWDWDSATSGTVTLPDGTTFQRSDADRSYVQRAFARTAGQPFPSLRGSIVGANASGSSTDYADLVRWWPASLSVVARSGGQFVAGGVPFSRYHLDLTVEGFPFPSDLTISVVRTGVPSEHQVRRLFLSARSGDTAQRKTRTVDVIRASSIRGNEEFVFAASVRRRDGTELSTDTARVTVGW